MPLDGGQTASGYPLERSANPKTQPGSGTVDAGLEDAKSTGPVSDTYPSEQSKNPMTNRVGAEVTGQDERGYVQTEAGNVPITNTSAGRVRKIPNP